MLLAARADPNGSDHHKPLLLAAKQNNPGLIKLLVEHKAWLGTMDQFKRNAMALAAEWSKKIIQKKMKKTRQDTTKRRTHTFEYTKRTKHNNKNNHKRRMCTH